MGQQKKSNNTWHCLIFCMNKSSRSCTADAPPDAPQSLSAGNLVNSRSLVILNLDDESLRSLKMCGAALPAEPLPAAYLTLLIAVGGGAINPFPLALPVPFL